MSRSGLQLLECGPNAALIRLADGDPTAVADRLRALPGVVESVPALDSVMVEWFGPAPGSRQLLRLAEDASAGDPAGRQDVRLVEIQVRYDGADLDWVASRTGMSQEAVARLHCSVDYTAAFCGFAPGFAYLTGLPTALDLPRLDTPRQRVPAGSVAIAAGCCGVYPSASPGGWRLIGNTEVRLFDPTVPEPALIRPGDRVRFVG